MFETLPNPSLEIILIAGRGLALLGAFWILALAFIRWRRADDLAFRALHSQIERTFAEVRGLHESISVMNARIEALSERAELEARPVPVAAGNSQRGYDMATRLARNGADIAEIVANCGITRHEAELLLRLNGGQRRPAAQAPVRRTAATEQQVQSPLAQAQRPQQERTDSEEEREMLTRAAPAQRGQKRGSLLSVVG